MFIAKAFPLLFKNQYSGSRVPLSLIHEQLKDVEKLFADYRLDLINDSAEIDKLETNGTIPKVMADQLRSEIEHRKEASSITIN